MTRKMILVTLLTAVLCICAGAQNAPPYKITKIRIIPFEQSSGAFERELATNEDPGYFNELSKSLFVAVEVSGRAGTYAGGRKVVVTVTEDARPKTSRTEALGVFSNAGRFYIPVLLNSAMCGKVVITARLTGQAAPSVMTRKLQFQCGE